MKSFFLLCTAKRKELPSYAPKNVRRNRAMKDRIRMIQDREGMSQKDFAAAVGISQASLSSIYNGRTLPTIRHAEAIHKRFPEINVNWILFGEGEMLSDGDVSSKVPSDALAGSQPEGESVRQNENPASLSDSSVLPVGNQLSSEGIYPGQVIIRETVKYVDKPQRRIREIQVIYDDGILETFVLKSE